MPAAAAVLGFRARRGAALSLALLSAEARELWTARFVGAEGFREQKHLSKPPLLILAKARRGSGEGAAAKKHPPILPAS